MPGLCDGNGAVSWRAPAAAYWISAALLVFFGLFLAWPVVHVLRGAFGARGEFTLAHFGSLLASPMQRQAIANSFFVASTTTALATLIALPIAYAMGRFRFPGKWVFSALLLVPMILPPFVGAIGLKQLLGRFGSLNLFLMDAGILPPDRPIDWLAGGGLWGIILLQTLTLFPILYLNLLTALCNLDPSLREAAQNLGASGWRVFRTITLPLILPGYYAGAIIVFVWSFTDLGTPLVFGQSRLVPVQIFDAVSELNTNPQGYALVILVLALTCGLFVVSKSLFSTRRYEMLSRGHTAGIEEKASPPLALLLHLSIGLIILLALAPHLMVVTASFAGRWNFSILPEQWTFSNYQELATHGIALASIRNSLFYSSCSAFLDLILGVAIAWVLARGNVRWAGVIDAVAMLPLALPGLVIAFGYVAAFDWQISWLNPKQNPALLLIISYSVRRLPYIVRSAYAGFQQTSVTLEEASANLGATPFRTLRKITLPLISAHLVAGTILTFAFAMIEVSDGLILAMRDRFYPMTKTIWQLLGRLEPNAPSVASAMGVLGMALLAACLLIAARALGQRLGQLFRA